MSANIGEVHMIERQLGGQKALVVARDAVAIQQFAGWCARLGLSGRRLKADVAMDARPESNHKCRKKHTPRKHDRQKTSPSGTALSIPSRAKFIPSHHHARPTLHPE